MLHLEGLAQYGKDNYGDSLMREYNNNHNSIEENPWLQDVVCCNAAINKLKRYDELLWNCINHIVNFEEEMSIEVMKEVIGLTDEELIKYNDDNKFCHEKKREELDNQ